MNSQKFQKSERNRRIKAMVFTVVFHALLFGGLAFGTSLGDKLTDTVKAFFPKKEKVQNASLVKNEK